MDEKRAQMLALIAVLAVILIAAIAYLVTLQRALEAVAKQNRKMEPGNVWVMLVPVVNLVFYFFIVEAMGESFRREYASLGVAKTSKPTLYIGIATGICMVGSYFFGFAALAGFTCWVWHWVRVSQCKNELINLRNGLGPDVNEHSIFG